MTQTHILLAVTGIGTRRVSLPLFSIHCPRSTRGYRVTVATMGVQNRYSELHAIDKMAGPGDARPTALQIIQHNDLEGKWTDKVVLITGCSSGIGIETAKAMKATGAKVYATVRDMDKGRAALSGALETGKLELLLMDLNSLDSVRTAAKELLSKESKLNVLINNAGIMMLPERTLTKDGFEAQFGVNHLAHFLLFQLLKPKLIASSTPAFQSRVVCVSSMGHQGSSALLDNLNFEKPDTYTASTAYGNAKTANIWMANEIERRYGGKGLHANSLHPGGIETGLQTHSKSIQEAMKKPEIIRIMKSPAQGAATSVWAAVDQEWEGKGGKYLDDCQISEKQGVEKGVGGGYAEHAYNEQGEKELWSKSCEMVGVKDD